MWKRDPDDIVSEMLDPWPLRGAMRFVGNLVALPIAIILLLILIGLARQVLKEWVG